MARPTKAIVDLAAIRQNYLLAQSLAPNSKTLAVVKANAYGHGARQVAEKLSNIADGYAVASIEEAVALRDSGIDSKILLLEGFFHPSELDCIDTLQLDVCLHSDQQFNQLLAHSFKSPITFWIKVDTGMHRLGFQPNQLPSLLNTLTLHKPNHAIVIMSHFACADETESDHTKQQIHCFNQLLAHPYPKSLCNSPGLLAWPEAQYDWTRPGMMLYGASPLAEENEYSRQLVPSMTLQSEVIAIRDVAVGDSVGYGASFSCDKPTRIATIPVGYGDGYPRQAPSGTPILVNGQRCALAGRVSMDMITVDVTMLPNCSIGDTVECWGKNILLKEVANACGTIPYELVTRMTNRPSKVYIG